jgi:hypothetical protein
VNNLLDNAEITEKRPFSDADMVKALRGFGAVVEPCGSRVTCEPAPLDTDEDWLVVAPDAGAISNIVAALGYEQFVWEGSEHYQNAAASDFMSWRRDQTNFIVTANEHFATRHRAATHVCKTLNLLRKEDRIMVFQAVLYGNVHGGADGRT